MVTVGQAALVTVDLLISRGADFDLLLRYSTGDPPAPVDLTGWTGRAQLRDSIGGSVWVTLTTNNNGITLGPDGRISLHLGHVRTESADWDGRRRGVWDMKLTDPTGRRKRFAQGTVELAQDVTRDA